ncbi:NAD(P)-binding protein [Macrolepiota fuliginosa MF-IS2]|uniref:NAD(P)-binding protein n=1 Tax=Macrolepiota fuliginosa MF-IS2 TaxID=1400762 RepID=A0A9P5XLN3_9AGAR|nr:NAD(P)-binding protein [Macrolepiota fuliginosa MF-IS2]
MAHISDDQLFEHNARVKDKVVVITGAANGIGKETAKRFASYGAKVVIGDRDIEGGKAAVREIEADGGKAVFVKCDVLSWDEQTAVFDTAISKYGSVDVVVPNAGVSETTKFGGVTLDKNGKPVKPKFLTMDINLTGVLYTVHLSLHYLKLNRKENDLKSIILIGSVASWMPIPGGPLYTASKHAILGVMRSLHLILELQSIRIGVIHPFFADTAIVPLPVKVVLAGIPLTPVPRVAGAIFYAATDPDPETSGCAWLLLDDGPVFRVKPDQFKQGVYQMIDDRANGLLKIAKGVTHYYRVSRDLWRLLGKQVVVLGLGAALAKVTWDRRELLASYIR